MLFNSPKFFLFFSIVYILYLFLNHRWQNMLLILASCLFYAAWNWKFLSVMIFSITVDYFCSRKIDASHYRAERRFFLILSITVNLSILAFFKYFNFFARNLVLVLQQLHWVSMTYIPWEIILPLGISFYTFEAISYVVDVYYRKTKPASNYWDYLLFVIYFPHLIAGPIMRAKSFLPQITQARRIGWNNFYEGCSLFFWGLFEKVFVADNLAHIVNPVFSPRSSNDGAAILIALYAFAFQIYCDFDGYSNMARGLGLCMGFDITINFKWPYFASNPREFWHRWHISLSTWLRDYVYIPLGGNQRGDAVMYQTLLITMILGGLWHGAAWTFVLWGVYQGMLLIIHRFYVQKYGEGQTSLFKCIVFFHFIVLGWLFFRAQSLSQVWGMIQGLFLNFRIYQIDVFLFLSLVFFITPFLLVQIWQYKANDQMVIYRQHWLLKTFLYSFMFYLLIGWGVMNAQEFIYFQF